MTVVKLLSCLLLYITVSCPESFAQRRIIKWAVQKHGTLWVNGSSNVNNFTCSITGISEYDTITVFYDPQKSLALRGAITMSILSFDCHNNIIRKDLRKTLKAEQYPTMIIRFLTLKTLPTLSTKAELVSGWVEVELAGVKKKFELIYSFMQSSPGIIRLNGGRKFNFSDFSLAPPQKFSGLIKIRDEFDVNFMLVLKTI
jgi:hypothetical protein